MTVKERLILFIKETRISTNKFEHTVGLSTGYLRQLRKEPSREKIKMIISAFPNLSEEWLLTGEGEMLLGEDTQNDQSVGNVSDSKLTGVNVRGSNINIDSRGDDNAKNIEALLSIVRDYQRTTERFQDHIDRLLSLLEKDKS